MRRLSLLLIALPALAAASAPVRPTAETVDQALSRTRAEAAAAEAEERRLEGLAARAGDQAAKLRARQAVAAQAIAAAEARLSAADAEARLLAQRLAAQRNRLRQQQAPASSLLAGLAMMARRPPLLAVADSGSIDELVRVRLLLDSTLPAIRTRTAALSRELERGHRLAAALQASRGGLASRRDDIAQRQRAFAELEQQALALAEERGMEALGAGDVALARGEEADRLTGEAARASAGRRLAAELERLGTAPARPFAPASRREAPPLAYRLPASAPVTNGFGEVNAAGIRARGLTLATRRGTPLAAPAAGTIQFAGPYRGHDGVIIIDHGGGWKSLILNARPSRRAGEKLRLGDQLGHALGPISVELSRNGRHQSPALIAGSSATLSNGRETG